MKFKNIRLFIIILVLFIATIVLFLFFSKETKHRQDISSVILSLHTLEYSKVATKKSEENISKHHAVQRVKIIQDKIQNSYKTRTEILKDFFHVVTKYDITDYDKWISVMEYLRAIVQHPEPIKDMVWCEENKLCWDPVLNMLFGLGKCGQYARIIHDIAYANGYESRVVQLAGHVIAEVKWDNKWHFIDADKIYFNRENLKNIFPDNLPSVKELSKNPLILLKFPTVPSSTENKCEYHDILYGYFSNVAFNQKERKYDIRYFTKYSDFLKWDSFEDYGWESIKNLEDLDVNREFNTFCNPQRPNIINHEHKNNALHINFSKSYRVLCEDEENEQIVTTTKVFPKCKRVTKDSANIKYEIRISSESRKWDYDMINLEHVFKPNRGDVAIYYKYVDKGKYIEVIIDDKILLGKLPALPEFIFVEVVPHDLNDKIYLPISNEVLINLSNSE